MKSFQLVLALAWSGQVCVTAYAQFSTIIEVPPDPAPASAEDGVQLTLRDGGELPDDFDAYFGSEVNILGGVVGRRFSANASSVVQISGGLVGPSFRAYDRSRITMSGGSLGAFGEIHDSSVFELAGGLLGDDFRVKAGATLVVSGGSATSVTVEAGAEIRQSGGTMISLRAQNSGHAAMSGGAIDAIRIEEGASFEIVGNEFYRNGALITGLEIGDTVAVNVPGLGALSGTLEDGTPFAFSSLDGDYVYPGTLQLRVAAVPPATPGVIEAGHDPTPMGIREGQSLVVGLDAAVDNHFNAGRGSLVTVETGGRIGNNLEAVGAVISIIGGVIGDDFAALDGSTVEMTAGSIGDNFIAANSVIVNLNGGSIGQDFGALEGTEVHIRGGVIGPGFFPSGSGLVHLHDGHINSNLSPNEGKSIIVDGGAVSGLAAVHSASRFTMNGGQIDNGLRVFDAYAEIAGGQIRDSVTAYENSTVHISGGAIGWAVEAQSGSALQITGGTIGNRLALSAGSETRIAGGTIGGPVEAVAGSRVTIAGGQFYLDDAPLTGLDVVGSTLSFSLPDDSILSGVLTDGTPFAVASLDNDLFAPGTLTLEAAPLPDIGPSQIAALTDPIPLGIRTGQTLTVNSGASVPSSLNVGRGATLLVASGGTVGENLEAGGGLVKVQGGVIDDDFDAFSNSVVELSAGAIGENFTAHSGTTVHISGGSIDSGFEAYQSVVVITGGQVDSSLPAANSTRIAMTGGSLAGDLQLSTHSAFVASGGSIGGDLTVGDASIVRLNGGTVHGRATLSGSSVLEMDDGRLENLLDLRDSTLHFRGGTIDASVKIDDNSDVVIQGGSINGTVNAWDSDVRIEGGVVGGPFFARSGNIAISGGSWTDFQASGNATVDIAGGLFTGEFVAQTNTEVKLSGGHFHGPVTLERDANLHLAGGAFYINDTPVAGLDAEGDTVLLDLDFNDVLSGFFVDGTPFAFAANTSERISQAVVTLKGVSLPVVNPGVIVASAGPIPKGLRDGQTLLVDAGGVVGDNFIAGHGSNMIVQAGAIVGEGFKAVGADVAITGGVVGNEFVAAAGSTVEVTGGRVAGELTAFAGGVVNLAGGTVTSLVVRGGGVGNILDEGTVEGFRVRDGGQIYVHGGVVTGQASSEFNGETIITGGELKQGINASLGGTVAVSGGRLRRLRAFNRSEVHLFGGILSSSLEANAGSSLTIHGSDFYLDNVPVEGLADVGASMPLDLSDGSVLTGLFADGTPFAFSEIDGDRFAADVLTLKATELPDIGPPLIVASIDPVPASIRGGQTLRVDDGAIAPADYRAGRGSILRVEEGGTMESGVDAIGAVVDVAGGRIQGYLDAYDSVVTVERGGVIQGLQAYGGSRVQLINGSIPVIAARTDSVIDVFGGSIDGWVDAYPDSTLHFFGTEFYLDDVLLPVVDPSTPFTVQQRDALLRVRFADGSELAQELNTENLATESYFDVDASILLTLVPKSADFNEDFSVDRFDRAAWAQAFGLDQTGDADKDGRSGGRDLLIWQRQLEHDSPSIQTPEPHAVVALLAAITLFCCWTRSPLQVR